MSSSAATASATVPRTDLQIDNYFSSNKREVIFHEEQYPFGECLDLHEHSDSFCMVIPRQVFIDNAEGWDDFRKGLKDYTPLAHIVALQFIAEALSNSKKMGTKPSAGKKASFYFGGETHGAKPKFRILAERLVARVHKNPEEMAGTKASKILKERGQAKNPTSVGIIKRQLLSDLDELRRFTEEPEVLWKRELMRDSNFVGIRFVFFAVDPLFKFADAMNRQIKINRIVRSEMIDDDDDDEDDVDAELNGAFGSSDRQRNGGGGVVAPRNIADEIDIGDSDDDDDDAFGGGAAAKKKKKRTPPKRYQKQKRRLFSKHDDSDKRRERLAPSDRPDSQFLHVTDVEVLYQVLFKAQLGTTEVWSNSTLSNPNYDIGNTRAHINLAMLLPKNIIPLAERLGADPLQCNPDNYYVGSADVPTAAAAPSVDDDAVKDTNFDTDSDEDGVGGGANVVLGAGSSARRRSGDGDDDEEKSNVDSDDDVAWESDDQEMDKFNEEARESGRQNLINSFKKSGADEETISKNINNVEKFANPRRSGFWFPCPELVWEYHPRVFSARELMDSYFPWYIHSYEYLEQKLLSTVLRCYRNEITNPQRVMELERRIVKEHGASNYGHCETIERFMKSTRNIRPDGGSAEQHAEMQGHNADPTTTLSRVFMDLEVAIQGIFSSHNAVIQCQSVYGDNATEEQLEESKRELYREYCNHLSRMRELATQHMYKVLNPDDDRLPDTVLAMLKYQREKDIRCLCLDSNAITLDLSPSYNQLIEFLLQMETLEISSTHLYILDVMIAIFSAYLCKERTGIELKNNIMMHGAPGTGKSNIIMTAVKQLIEDSVDCVTARSLTAMVNPKSRNFTPEVFDESAPIFDAPDRALSAVEKKAKRIEQSGMTKQQIDYAYTDYDKLTGKRSVRKIKMPYEHVKIVATNVPRKRKKDAMDDRWKHITVEVRRRPGKDIINFKTALHSKESQIHQSNIKSRQERLQLLVFFSCISNKLCGLPRPNLDVMHIRLSQTIQFLSRHAPNAMFRVRSLDMLTSEILIDTIRSCDQICFGSELSPFRRLADNEMYVKHAKERDTYREDDARNYRIEMQDFRYEHLLALGPQFMCTDDLAIRSITGSVTNLLQPVYYSVIYYLALEYGSLDIRTIFNYFDDEGENGYRAAKERYAEFDQEIRDCGNRMPPSYKGGYRPIDEINKETIDESMASGNSSAGAGIDQGAPLTVSGNDRKTASLGAKRKVIGGSMRESSLSSSLDVTGAASGAVIYSQIRGTGGGGDGDDIDNDGETKKDYVYAWKKPIKNPNNKKKRNGRGNDDSAPNASDAHGGDEVAYQKIYVSGTSRAEQAEKQRDQRIPTFNRFEIEEEQLVTFCPSYLKLNCTAEELKHRGRDLCRKHGIDYETFAANVESLMHLTVRLRHVPNIPEGLDKDRDYINYRLASKLDLDYEHAIVQSADALMCDKSCMYLAVDLLLEAPDRIVEKLVRDFEYEHTVPRRVLLGVADPDNPFCLRSIDMKPRPGKKINVDNVNYRNSNIQDALYSGINTMMGAVHDPMADRRRIHISGDLELWALERHFESSGYDKRYIQHFLPSNEHRMLMAIYRELLLDQAASDSDNAVEPLDSKQASRMIRLAYERYSYQRELAKEKVVKKDTDGEEAYREDQRKFRLMFGVLNGLRKQYRRPLLRYPQDLIIPGHDRKIETERDRMKKKESEADSMPPPSKKVRADAEKEDENDNAELQEEATMADVVAAAAASKRKRVVDDDDDDDDDATLPRVPPPTQDEIDEEMSTMSSIEHSRFEPGVPLVPRSTGTFRSPFGQRSSSSSSATAAATSRSTKKSSDWKK